MYNFVNNSISIKNINHFYDSYHALKNVSLDIKSGEFFSLLGPSGCGKTTLLRIIAGFLKPDEGCVFLGDHDMTNTPSNKRPVNTIFQKYALFPHLTVYENIAFSFRVKGMKEAEFHEKVLSYAGLARLEKHLYKYPSQLSGGQQQRVAIARALANEPKVLLLDEPLSALDAKLRQHMLLELDRIHDEVGITFILVTHDQEEALSVSDRIAVMNEGEVLQVGTPVQLYETPADVFVADFIGENNFIKGRVTEILDQTHARIACDLGEIIVEMDKNVSVGQNICLTIRPEKIEVLKNKPELPNQWHNLVKGKVYDVIYSGFQSKYFLQIPGYDFYLKAFEQHDIFFEDGTEIVHWGDEAWYLWDADDSYIVHIEDADENQ
ncbi:MAG: ABC transporter ATP-binding protein [Brevinemataceae bacterium]